MPHDKNGKLLAEGDKIILRGTVKSIQADPGNAKYCNLSMECDEPMPAYPDQKQTIQSLNAAMVEKVEPEKPA